MKDVYSGKDAVIGLVTSSYVEVPFHFRDEVTIVRELMQKYQSVPMSFADPCLVRMNELILGSSLLTLDSYFRIYRKNKTEIIDVIIPDELSVHKLVVNYQLFNFFDCLTLSLITKRKTSIFYWHC